MAQIKSLKTVTLFGAALFGSSSQQKASALDNGFSTPPMGWSALYGAPFQRVNETNVQEAAAGLVAGGLLKFGYRYVNLDDWFMHRDSTTGKPMGGPNFPSGMRATADVVHSHGLQFGIYSAASQRTCGNYSASLFREHSDAAVFANEWEIDYLKYDACIYNNGVASRARYLAMSRALNATGRKIFYSVEGWSGTSQDQGDWGPQLANMWRTGNDIWPRWDHCILNNLYTTNAAAQYMVPGKAWNDPDMLQPPANISVPVAEGGLTFEESRSQFVLWAVMKAPLILGIHYSNLATLSSDSPQYYDVITNPEIIAIDQDPSTPAVVKSQMPSQQQQQATAAPTQVTMQVCDPSRPDQRWAQPSNSKQIQAAGTNLCLDATSAGSGNFTATTCSTTLSGQNFQSSLDTKFHAITLVSSPSQCVANSNGATVLSMETCLNPGDKLPPPLNLRLAEQLFVWDEMTGQIVSGGSGLCVTLGLPNYVDSQWVTNNGTLHHEVWTGMLSTGKQVVVLFNKGDATEKVTASPELVYDGCANPCPVRDVLARKDLAPIAKGSPLSANVASHGTQLYLLG